MATDRLLSEIQEKALTEQLLEDAVTREAERNEEVEQIESRKEQQVREELESQFDRFSKKVHSQHQKVLESSEELVRDFEKEKVVRAEAEAKV